jgi:ATP-dependent Clp protease adaptor protein ClpS
MMEYMINSIVVNMSEDTESEEESGIAVLERSKVQKPRMFKVLLHNDDYTTMEFVVHVLERFFKKVEQDAQRIMMEVHMNGIGACGVYTKEVAETKTAKVNDYAEKQGHPLKCSFEPCESED